MTEVTKLKRVVLPSTTSILGKTAETLERGERATPIVTRLDFDVERRLVFVQIQGNEDTAMIPLERVSSMIPMREGDEEKYGITPLEQRMKAAQEEADRQAALKAAAVAAKAEEVRQRSLLPANPTQAIDEANAMRAKFKKDHAAQMNTPFPGGEVPEVLKTEAEKAQEEWEADQPKPIPAPSKTRIRDVEPVAETTVETPWVKVEDIPEKDLPKPKKRRGRKPGSKNKKKKGDSK